MHDYNIHYRFSPDDLADWPGRILLIESTHDEAFSPAARAALRALYPQAQLRTFGGGGHAVMVGEPAEYVAAVRAPTSMAAAWAVWAARLFDILLARARGCSAVSSPTDACLE